MKLANGLTRSEAVGSVLQLCLLVPVHRHPIGVLFTSEQIWGSARVQESRCQERISIHPAYSKASPFCLLSLCFFPALQENDVLEHTKSKWDKLLAQCLGMKIQAGPGGSPANYLEILRAALHQQTLRWNLSLGNLTSQRVTRELNFRSLNWVLSWNHLSPRRSLHVPNTADFLTHLRQICGGFWLIFKTLPSFSCLSKVWRKLEIISIKSNYICYFLFKALWSWRFSSKVLHRQVAATASQQEMFKEFLDLSTEIRRPM